MHFLIAQKTYRINLQYRYTQLINAFGSAIIGFILVCVWRAGSTTYGGVGKYSTANLISWIAFAQVLFNIVHPATGLNIQKSVRTGNISLEFLRPINYFTYVMSRELGRQLYALVFKSIPIFLIYWALFSFKIQSFSQILLLIFTIVLGVYISMCINYLVGISALFTTDIRWANTLSFSLLCVASGSMIPVDLLPGVVGKILSRSPWACFMNPACSVFVGLYNNNILVIPLVWSFILTLTCLGLTNLGKQKVEVQGG